MEYVGRDLEDPGDLEFTLGYSNGASEQSPINIYSDNMNLEQGMQIQLTPSEMSYLIHIVHLRYGRPTHGIPVVEGNEPGLL